MAGSEIKVTPDAVVEAVARIAALRGELAGLTGSVEFAQSKGRGASSLMAVSTQVSRLVDSVDELLASDQRRLTDGLVAFEGADSSAARMIRGLSGVTDR